MGAKQGLSCLLLFLWFSVIKAQQFDFQFPLDTTPLLSGTFGEFRGSHFHAGIDIKTYGQTGLPVHATADGYVSRIKISPFGYGKAIYLTHHNGYTSVYGHLSGFNPELEKYIQDQQYHKKSYSIELFPGKSQFPIKKGDIIAYSGNTGGSYAPHLHFELRDSRTQEILDPLAFSLPVTDTLKPVLREIKVIRRSRDWKISTGAYPVYATGPSDEALQLAPGEYGLILAAKDLMTSDTSNILGVYSVSIMEGSDPLYTRETKRFSFSDSRYIHLISANEEGLPPLELCYKEPWQKIDMANYFNDGWIQLEEGQTRTFTILLRDQYGNESDYSLILQGNAAVKPKQSATIMDPELFLGDVYKEEYSAGFNRNTILVDFFKNAFPDTLQLYGEVIHGQTDTLHLMPENAYVADRFRVIFTLPSMRKDLKSKVCIIRKEDDALEYVGGNISGSQISGYSRHMGKFYLGYDTIAPTISEPEVRNDTLFIQIEDDFSGIASYYPTVDGKWYLMEYDPKTGILFGHLANFSDESKLELKLIVKDHKDNSTTLSKTILLR